MRFFSKLFNRCRVDYFARYQKNDSPPLWAYRVVEIFPFDDTQWTVEFSFKGRDWQRLFDSEYYGAGYSLTFVEANDLAKKLVEEASDRQRAIGDIEAKQAAANANAIVYIQTAPR